MHVEWSPHCRVEFFERKDFALNLRLSALPYLIERERKPLLNGGFGETNDTDGTLTWLRFSI